MSLRHGAGFFHTIRTFKKIEGGFKSPRHLHDLKPPSILLKASKLFS